MHWEGCAVGSILGDTSRGDEIVEDCISILTAFPPVFLLEHAGTTQIRIAIHEASGFHDRVL